ncbi:unnamed protein product [Moneuplotes crassus]|uniref:Uncharacterized protein n=1 Tax=Euplotes crassus TaxID=5936 RepID=A0AAD1YA09_EUPCR|nr:unnamed protein product [Moneuplotes crassus]
MGNTSPTSGTPRAEEILKKAEHHNLVRAFKKETIQELLKGDKARELLGSACSRKNDNEGIKNIFPGLLDKESNNDELQKEWESNLEEELNEFYTAGVSTPENFIKSLQDTSKTTENFSYSYPFCFL